MSVRQRNIKVTEVSRFMGKSLVARESVEGSVSHHPPAPAPAPPHNDGTQAHSLRKFQSSWAVFESHKVSL